MKRGLRAASGLITSREWKVGVVRVAGAKIRGGSPHSGRTRGRASPRVAGVRSDLVAVEEPLEIRIDGRALGVTMRTPGHDEELAAGLLLAEGVITRPQDIGSIAVCRHPENLEERNVVTVYLREGLTPDWERLRRSLLTNSSCGLCGKASIESLTTRARPLPAGRARIEAGTLIALPARLRGRQEVFAATGGLHAAGLFTTDGTLEVLREDVGRHNAVDKVIGTTLLEKRFPPESRVLLVSGRASYEIVQKAAVARIPIIAAVSAPSSLAVGLADAMGVTLVGFLRGDGFNIYSHPRRIVRPRARTLARGPARRSPRRQRSSSS
jgi:FdhD protein